MWQIEPSSQWPRDLKHYEKKRPRELEAVLNNLQRYLDQLNVAVNSRVVQGGYLHREPNGVVAVDQKGGGAALQQTRLYTFADDKNKILHLISIGDKDNQPEDIKSASNFVKRLKESQQ